MKKFYLSAFADEYSEHFEAQLKMLSEQNIKYIEPHLMDFAGLNDIAKKSFENPVNFSSAEEAFLFAADKIKNILSEV